MSDAFKSDRMRDYDVPSEQVPSESDQRTVNNSVRHTYRVLSEDEKAAMIQLKDVGIEFMHNIERLVPKGREAALAKTKVEEAVMWSVKGLTG